MQDAEKDTQEKPTPGEDQAGASLDVRTIPSFISHSRIEAVFEQSRSTKGVAVGSFSLPPDANTDFNLFEETILQQVIKHLRSQTEEAHGFDVMPYPDSLYYFEPWPPKGHRNTLGGLTYRTVLKFGDGVTNLRDHAAFMLKMARARGVKIRIPINNPAPRIEFERTTITAISPENLRLIEGDAPGLISRGDLP